MLINLGVRHTQEKLEKVKKTNWLIRVHHERKRKPFLISDFLKGLVTQNSKRLS